MAYDVDKRRAKTLSAETALSDKIFGRNENILSRNNYEVRGKYVSYGKCECFTKAHRQTRFIIELNSKVIGVQVIHDIEDDLDSLDVEFAHIVTRSEKRSKTFLDLVFVQIIGK